MDADGLSKTAENISHNKIFTAKDENYHSLFEQATDAIMVTDFKGNFIDVNSSCCDLFGYTKEELLSINVSALLDKAHLISKPIRFDLLADGQNIFNEREMLHKNGATVYVESNAKKLGDNRILVITRDISKRKEVEHILQKSEADLHTIFDTTDTIYVLMDHDLRIISYNPRAYAFAANELGHTIEISEYFLDYFPEDKRSGLQQYMTAVLKGKTVTYEINYPQDNGTVNWYHVRIFPISKGDKNIYGLMMAVSNITEKKLLEQELIRQKILEQKRITKAVVSAQENERAAIGEELHDNVNQLLATSRLYLNHCINHPGDHNESIVKCYDYISAAMEELRKLSHALVGPTQDKTIGLINSLEELIRDTEAVKDIRIHFRHCFHKEEKCEVGLKLVIYRIIQEQINNILKYAEATEVNIELDKKDKDLIVIINDNGKGFDLYAKRKGIGLKNIKNRAELYNGTLEIISSPGNGCKMKIVFKNK